MAVQGENGPAVSLVSRLCGKLGLDVQYMGSLTDIEVLVHLPRANCTTLLDSFHPVPRSVISKMSIGIPASHPLSSGLKTQLRLLCTF